MNEYCSYADQSAMSYWNMQPSQVKGRYNASTEYHKRYLYNKLFSRFKFTLPKEWDLNFFRFYLFRCGSIAVIYTNEYGWVAQPYGIVKLNLYYNPAEITVFNQFFRTDKTGIIGVNAEIIHLFDDYFGFDDLVTRYAEILAQIDRSINVNLMNSNVAMFFPARSKKQADEIKEAYALATTGVPFVTINKDVMGDDQIEPMLGNVKNNYIVDALLEARRNIINQFLTEVGIANANTDKKERLITDEVNQNNDETKAIIAVVYDNLKKCFDKVNQISGLSLNVELRKEGGEDVKVNTDGDA